MTSDLTSNSNSHLKRALQHAPSTWARPAVAAVLLSVLAGCASSPAGTSGYDAFRAEATLVHLRGPRDAAQAAQCFEEQATFLPLSTFSRDTAQAAFTYRLRLTDLWFEEVRIAPDGGGSRAEVRLAPNLDAKWRGQFDRDRAAALRACLGADGLPPSAAPAATDPT